MGTDLTPLRHLQPGGSHSRRHVVGLVLGVSLALFAAISIGALLRMGRTAGVQSVGNVEGAMLVTASEMAATYLDSRAGADHRYGKRDLLLSGTVAGVSLDDADGQARVTMDGGTVAEISPRSHVLVSSIGRGDRLSLLCHGVRFERSRPHAQACLFHDAELG